MQSRTGYFKGTTCRHTYQLGGTKGLCVEVDAWLDCVYYVAIRKEKHITSAQHLLPTFGTRSGQ
eukprot:scaffold211300_cov39-Prasinocladus_malaysianus.AAC.2